MKKKKKKRSIRLNFNKSKVFRLPHHKCVLCEAFGKRFLVSVVLNFLCFGGNGIICKDDKAEVTTIKEKL